MGLFDNLQRTAQNVVSIVMGTAVKWVPYSGAEAITAMALFNNPTDKQERVGEISLDILKPRIEYYEGDFPGLLESVLKNTPERIIVKGKQYVTAKNGSRKYDGKTIIIQLDEI